MPQISLEYSDNLFLDKTVNKLFSDIHQLLTRELPTQLANCKSRCIVRDHYFLADGQANQAFAHLHIRIMPGRSDEKKTFLGHVLLEMMNQFFQQQPPDTVLQLSVEIEDVGEHFFKKQAIFRSEDTNGDT